MGMGVPELAFPDDAEQTPFGSRALTPGISVRHPLMPVLRPITTDCLEPSIASPVTVRAAMLRSCTAAATETSDIVLAKLSHAAARCVIVMLRVWALKQEGENAEDPYAVNSDQHMGLVAEDLEAPMAPRAGEAPC